VSNSVKHTKSLQEGLRLLSEGLLRSVSKAALSGHVLEIRQAAAPVLNPEFLHSTGYGLGELVSLNKGSEPSPDQPVVCETARLPFQDKVFSMVVLHHVVSDGMESELEEAVRVLARAGVLIILGINRMGWRFRFQGQLRRLPGIAPLKVKSRLDRLDMAMRGFAGAGIFGRKLPEFMSTGMAGLGIPIADVVLLQARHKSGPEMTPLNSENWAPA
jgi:SAM-dependent methyltransferase